jgi:hypothetical protein
MLIALAMSKALAHQAVTIAETSMDMGTAQPFAGK